MGLFTYCTYHRQLRDAERNAKPERVVLYGGAWAAYSRRRRAQQPYCQRCGDGVGLTVDHPTDAVLCRSCHGRLEAARREVRSKK